MVSNKDEMEKTTKRSKHYKLHDEKPGSRNSIKGNMSPNKSTKSPRKDASIGSSASRGEGDAS